MLSCQNQLPALTDPDALLLPASAPDAATPAAATAALDLARAFIRMRSSTSISRSAICAPLTLPPAPLLLPPTKADCDRCGAECCDAAPPDPPAAADEDSGPAYEAARSAGDGGRARGVSAAAPFPALLPLLPPNVDPERSESPNMLLAVELARDMSEAVRERSDASSFCAHNNDKPRR